MTGENMRAAGKAVIINQKGLVLVIKRSGDETHLENLWDVPGGRFDYRETPQEGLEREVREEAGIEIEVIEPVNSWSFMRDSGQQVFGTTFLCEPEGLEVDLGDEHTDFKWVRKESLDDLKMHDELREGLKESHEKWRKSSELPKLVRDKIPEIIEENEEDEVLIREVKGPEYERFLREKIVEEAKEFTEDGEIEELADLVEAVDTYMEKEDISEKDLEEIRKRKRVDRGGFSEGLVLEDLK